jgi:hypothetical protein
VIKDGYSAELPGLTLPRPVTHPRRRHSPTRVLLRPGG